ncbi:unnamed protein product [Cunninghamella echinulata]
MFFLPGLVLYKLGHDWLRVRTLRTRRDRLERIRLQQLEKQKRQHEDKDHEDDERLKQQRLQQQRETEEEELISRKIQPQGQVSLDDTLMNIMVINGFVDRGLKGLEYILLHFLDGTRPEILIATLSLLVYIIPFWFLLVWLLGTHGMLALLGSAYLFSFSPWYHVLVCAIQRQPLLRYIVSTLWAYSIAVVTSWKAFDFLGNLRISSYSVDQTQSQPTGFKKWISYIRRKAQDEKQSAINQLKTKQQQSDENNNKSRNEMIFQFEVYENQRWWLGANWTTNMLNTERNAWTDNQLVSITSKEGFQLPEATEKITYLGPNKNIKQATRKVWSWADNDWWVDMTGELDGLIDHNGWEYGNNAWQNFTGIPTMQTFTRRRRWCRRARLVERIYTDDSTNNNNNNNNDQNIGMRRRNIYY